MDSIFRTSFHSPLRLLSCPHPHKPSPSLKPLLSLNPNPNPNPKPKSPKTPQNPSLSFFLKPTLITLTATALFLSHRFPKPSLASPPPPPSQAQTLTDAEKIETLEEFLESHPDDVRSLRALLELRIKSGRIPEAISVIDRLVALEPDNADLPLLRCHLLAHAGDPEAARAGFEEVLQRDPLSVEAYHGLVMIEKDYPYPDEKGSNLDEIKKRVEAATEACRKERRKEDLRDFKLLAAQIRVVEGRYEEALRLYEELVKEDPRDFRPYLCEGIVYSVLRRKDEAEKVFEKYRRLVPKGHLYARYYDDNVLAMKVFSQVEENKRKGGGPELGGR